uniref:IRG-type G domain-containing protein n=1 Tax=Oryctolagus cuniculus TaxID=9986 RepID=G1TUP2_RABIT
GASCLARGTSLLDRTGAASGASQSDAQTREQTSALLARAGLGAAALFVLPADWAGSEDCEELERLRGALRSRAEALQRLLPAAQDGFEVLGAAELEAVREAFEKGGLEAALSWVRAGLERLGSARLDLAVAGATGVSLVLDALLGLDPGPPGAVPAPAGPAPFPAPERPNVVFWVVPLDPAGGAAPAATTPHPTHYDALILVTSGAPTEEDWAQVRALVPPDAALVCVRTDGEGEDPEAPEEETVGKPSGGGRAEPAPGDGREKAGPGPQAASAGEGPERAGSRRPQQGGGDAEGSAALSPEDETWEVLEETPPPVFPLRPGGLAALSEW